MGDHAPAGAVEAGSREALWCVLRDACRRVIPFDVFFILSYDAGTHTFGPFGGDDAGPCGLPDGQVAGGLIEERVVRERRSLRVLRADDPAAKGIPSDPGASPRPESVMYTPILSGGDVLGILCVQSTTPDLYTERDEEVVEVIASLAATALENLRLVEERRAAEETLRERELQLREAQRIAHLGSWTWTIKTNRVTWSDELYRIYGLEPQAFGASFEAYLACVHPADRPHVQAHIERALHTGASFEFEERIVRPDGTVRVLRSSGEVTCDADGQPVSLVGVCQDITDLKAAEEALHASEESYRTIFELASDAIFVHDIETGAVLDANRRACELHGCTLDELKALGIGGISDGHPPFDAEHARAYVRRAAEGEPQRFEWLVQRKTGERFWVEVSLQRVRILGEARVLASVRNIDERKQAEAALHRAHDELEQRVKARTAELAERTEELAQAEQRFRAIVEASPTPLLLSRHDDGVILYANDRLEALIGAAPGSLTGQNTPDFYVDPEDRPRVLDAVREQGYVRDLELCVKRADGTPRWAALSVQRLTFDGELALATALIDITERKQAEATLRLQKTLLEAQGEASIDGILVVSDEGKILSYNHCFVEMWDIPPEVVASKSDEAAILTVLNNLQDPEAFLARVDYLYEHPHEKARDEIALRDGRVFDRYSAPVVSSEGDYYGRIWFFRDMTAQKRHAEELEQARQEAEQARVRASRYAKNLERELEVGRQIQRGFLPAELPQPPGWEIAARFRPAWQVAGDFYDAFELDGRIGLVIADVCGKGVGAALFMALFQSLLRVYAERAGTPTGGVAPSGEGMLLETIGATNAYIIRMHKPAHTFASVFFGLLDPGTGTLHYVNAGHEPPVMFGPEGPGERLMPTGPALGLMADARFEVAQITLSPEDGLLAFTDGVTEARNAERDFFTEERLIDLLTDPPSSATCLLDRIEQAVRDFTGEAASFDDLTLLALRRAGAS